MRETARARRAWADYLAMGPERSLEKLLERYQTGTEPAPAKSLTRLKEWSRTHGWQARLQEIADREAEAAEEREAEFLRESMETGYALVHYRVAALKTLAGKMFEELTKPGGLWCQEVKQIGSGESAREVTVEKFNAGEVEQLRGVLDDIAREKGDRKNKIDMEGSVKLLRIVIDEMEDDEVDVGGAETGAG